MKAFHFTNGMKLRDGEELIVGKTYIYEGEIKICKSGYHASKRILDAIYYAPGFTLSLVECSDIITEHADKFVCRTRTVLETHNVRDEIILWAANCAEDALKTIETPDKRTLDAIQAVRDFVAGKITIDELMFKRAAAASASADADADAAYAAASIASYAAYASYAAGGHGRGAAASYASYASYAAASIASYAGYADSEIKEYESKLIEIIQKKFKNNLTF